jgi:hypothetical protein
MHSTLNYVSPIQFEQNWNRVKTGIAARVLRQPEEAVEMPVHGKHGKNDEAVFPTLPTDVGNRCGDSHIPTATTTTGMNIFKARPVKGYAFWGKITQETRLRQIVLKHYAK